MSDKRVSFGIFQLSSHPAVCLADRDMLKEPVVPKDDKHSLTILAREVIELRDCLDEVKERYIKWQEERLERLLTWLITQPRQPDIVVFPECSIPFECIHIMRRYSVQTGIIFFAGTHTPRVDKESQGIYRKNFKVRSKQAKDIFQQPPPAVLPIVTPTETLLHRKGVPSIFERSDVDSPRRKSIKTNYVNISDPSICITPFVCAEALRLKNWSTDYPDVVIIVAMERNPARFNPVIESLISNKVPVVVANDAAYGGSGVFTAVDRRSASWWFSSPNHGQLPVGEAYLEVELDLETVAVEVSVSDPGMPARLARLAPILSGDSPLLSTEQEIQEAAEKLDAAKLKGVRIGAGEILLNAPLTSRRLTCLESLAENGTLTTEWNDALSKHVSLVPQSGLPELERILAQLVQKQLSQILESTQSGDLSNDIYAPLSKLSHTLQRQYGVQLNVETKMLEFALPIGRADEIRQVREFTTNSTPEIMAVTGLQAVGKSTVVGSALKQLATNELVVDCVGGISADGLFEFLLRATGRVPRGVPPRDRFSTDDLTDALRDWEIVWFRGCHHLTEYGNWRTKSLERFFETLLVARQRTQTLLLFESRRVMSFTEPLGTQILRRRINGFSPEDGRAFFEQQLRRAGGSLQTFSPEDREEIVSLVSGHPGMLILCADVCVQDGANQVINDLKGGRGFFFTAIKKMLKAVKLSQDAEVCLGLLAKCRWPVPLAVVSSAVGNEKAKAAVPELTDACVVNRTSEGHLEVISLLSQIDLKSDQIAVDTFDAFHRSASSFFVEQTKVSDRQIAYHAHIEANYHAVLAGDRPPCDLTGLVDDLAAAARIEFDSENYDRVVQILTGVGHDRMPEDLHAILVKSYAWSNRFREAFDLADRVVKKNRTYVSLFTDTCNAAIRSRNWDIAKEALRKAEQLEPGYYQIYRFKGQLAEHEGRRDKAIEYYEAAVNATSRDPWPYFYLLRALVRRGQPEKALDVADEAREMTNGMASRAFENAVLSQELLALVMSGEEGAATHILNVVEHSEGAAPEMIVTAAYVKAYLVAIDGQHNAISIFDKALTRLRRNDSQKAHVRAKIALFRGKLHEHVGDIRSAEIDYTEACRFDSHNVHMKECYLRVLCEIAKNAKRRGDASAAESAARRATEIASEILKYDANHGEAHNALQDLHYLYGIS